MAWERDRKREREQAGRRKGKSSVNKWSVSRAREGSEGCGKGKLARPRLKAVEFAGIYSV